MTLDFGSSLDLELMPGLVDDIDASLAGGRRSRRRVRRETADGQSRDSTLGTTSLDRVASYDVSGDEAALLRVVEEKRLASMLDVAARELSRAFSYARPRAVLVTDVDHPDEKTIALVVSVQSPPGEAVDSLFRFTGSDWWMRIVDATDGALVVDVECA